MSAAAGEAQVQAQPTRAAYWAKQLFSFLGIVPLGVYVVLHLFHNASSLNGPQAYNAYLAESRNVPLYGLLVLLFVYAPIAYHALYGLAFTFRGRPNVASYPFYRNWKYLLQRVSGLGLLVFIPAHVYKEKYEQAAATDFLRMYEALHEPLTFWVYVLGVLGVAYHLANGIWDLCFAWGITTGEKGRRTLDGVAVVLFLLVAALGFAAMRGLMVAPA